MIDKDQAIKLVKQFIKDVLCHEAWYQSIKPSTKATLLYGSVAKGTNKDGSDIDILLIVPLEKEEKHTVGEYFFNYQGQEINIVLRSIERLREIAKNHNDMEQKEVFKGGVIIEQSDDEVSNLLKEIATI